MAQIKIKVKQPTKKFVEPKKGTNVGFGYKVGEGEMGKKETPVKQQAKMAAVSTTYKKK